MKAGFLLLLLLSGCVAVPPLVTVQHHASENANLKSRVDALERRVNELEQKSAR